MKKQNGGKIMNGLNTAIKRAFHATLLIFFITNFAHAQDATKVDPKHYKVEFENDQVRVVRISYGPHEKSVMHEHAPGVLVFLTDGEGIMTFPDGRKEDSSFEAGKVGWESGVKHLPENTGDYPHELILVELKDKQGPSKEK